MPILMDLQQTYGPKGFTVLAVSVDDDGAEIVAPWVEKNLFELDGKKQKVNFPVLLSTISMAEDYADIFAFPATFLVDANGNLVRRIDGALEEDDITAAVKGLMAGR